MTNEEKGERYDALIREGYALQNKISTLKSDVFKAQTPEVIAEIAVLQKKQDALEYESNQLLM
jgi:hypothetical protein|tara:strand:- start:115 stop:303 length:189 start_codon:yes stop_codon:yes gene_type:complete